MLRSSRRQPYDGLDVCIYDVPDVYISTQLTSERCSRQTGKTNVRSQRKVTMDRSVQFLQRQIIARKWEFENICENMFKLLATTTKKNQGSNVFLRNTPAASSTSLFSWQDKKKHKVNEWVNRVCDFDKKLRIHLQMSHSALLLLPTNFQIVTERFFSPDFDHIMVCETTEKFQICASLGLIK